MTPNIHLPDRSISYLGTCISINSGGVKLVICVQTSTLSQTTQTCMSFTCEYHANPHILNEASSFVVKNKAVRYSV